MKDAKGHADFSNKIHAVQEMRAKGYAKAFTGIAK